MKTKNKLLILMVFLALGGSLTACNPNGEIVSGSTGDLGISPPEANFSGTKQNDKTTQSFELTNNSKTGTLRVLRAKIIEQPNDNDEDRSEFSSGEHWVKGATDLNAGETIVLDVDYRPQDQYADKGVLRVYVVGDAKYPDGYVDIPLESEDIVPAILTSNPVVLKNRVRPGQWACRDEVVQNIGIQPLKISAAAMSGSNEFHVRYFAKGDEPDHSACANTNEIGGKQLSEILATGNGKANYKEVVANELPPNEYFHVRYFYIPKNLKASKAKLTFNTNIPNRETGAKTSIYNISINGNSDGCLEINPPEIDFGKVLKNTEEETAVSIRNCSTDEFSDPLQIKKITVSGEQFTYKDGTFTKAGSAVADEESKVTDDDDDTFIELFSGDSRTFKILFSAPIEEGESEGELIVEMTDSSYQEERAKIVAESTADLPPRPKAYLKRRENEAGSLVELKPPVQEYGTKKDEVLKPTSKVQLGVDPRVPKKCEGQPIEYEWKIVKQPVKDALVLGAETAQKEPKITLNNVGEYVFSVIVKCAGLESEEGYEPSRVTLLVKPDSPIYVELSWQSPNPTLGPAHPGDTGPDLDLFVTLYKAGKTAHSFLGPRAVYADQTDDGSSPHKSYVGPKNAFELIVDDRDGSGPEAIRVSKARSNYIFDVGVECYETNGFPYTYATVKIYTGGELKAVIPKIKISDKEFIHVAEILYNKNSQDNSFTGKIRAVSKRYASISAANSQRTVRTD